MFKLQERVRITKDKRTLTSVKPEDKAAVIKATLHRR